MSHTTSGNEIDLIDFHVTSPVLPRASPHSIINVEDTDNLLDSELPVLEKKLQATYNDSTCNFNINKSVDIEDILINFQDEIDSKNDKDSNSELLDVLKNLDEILNTCLEESDDKFDGDCDNTDGNFDNSDSESLNSSFRDNILIRDDQKSTEIEDIQTIRSQLRNYETNYNKFLSLGHVNRGYINTEDSDRIYRTLSECDLYNLKENLSNHKHATLGGRKKAKRGYFRNNANDFKQLVRRPRSATVDSCEDIDWSWLEEVARDIEVAADLNSNSDVETSTSNERENQRHENSVAAMRLRDSMRRLDPLLLPANTETFANDESGNHISRENRNSSIHHALSQTRSPILFSSNINSSESAQNRPLRSRSCDSYRGERRARNSFSSTRSRRPRSSSSLSSMSSSAESSPSFNPSSSPLEAENQAATTSSRPTSEPIRRDDTPQATSPLGNWPHGFSSMLACLSCTLGLFNICRFAILSVHFGANFIVQFFFLSLVFGLPLLTLQLCLGQQLGAGVVDMWKISPLFQGVGISMLIAQILTGLYSVTGVSWLFVYFRDSFITKFDNYRWAEPYLYYRKDIQLPENGTYKLSETVPDYFNGVVLQRQHISSGNSYGTIKFQLAFNLAVVWMIVFVSLSKGLRSYGKVIYVFTFLPVISMFILCVKMLGHLPPESAKAMFPEINWSEFFLNPKSWIAAAQETFLTWGLLGAAVMQIASHNKKHKHSLHRDSSLVAITTLTVLLLAAFLANTCVHILKYYGYSYLPSSFEQMSSYVFLRPAKDPLPPSLANTPVQYMTHNLYIAGDRVIKPNMDITTESGYQVMRFATELIPATFAVLGTDLISPFWAVLFYFTLIMFGIAEQLAIWHCVITGIIAFRTKLLKHWETTITFFSCVCGFITGLPMATEIGIYVVYFFDYTVGAIWWLVIIILFEIIAVFMVRGRPYSGDKVVLALFNKTHHPCITSWAPGLLSFTWNVILPVGLTVLCISTFKNGYYREMFIWHHGPVSEYWPLWARQLGSLIQMLPIFCIPLVALIQSYRYLNNGPTDILDRIQLLYRPPIGEHMDEVALQEAVAAIRIEATATAIAVEDPPPKYTPPPSYTTATGATLAKLFHQTLRRSIRRIAGALGSTRSVSRPRASVSNNNTSQFHFPPAYNTVFVEMNGGSSNNGETSHSTDTATVQVSTMERLRNLQSSSTALTAAEVASILRSSLRRSTLRPRNRIGSGNSNNPTSSLSAQNLVSSAAPMSETSLVNEPNSK